MKICRYDPGVKHGDTGVQTVAVPDTEPVTMLLLLVVVAVVAGDWCWYCTAPPLPVRDVVVGNFWDLFIYFKIDKYLVDKSVDIHRC